MFLVPPTLAVLLPVGIDSEGTEPRHSGDHGHHRRGDLPRRRCALVEIRPRHRRPWRGRYRSPTTTCTTTSASGSSPSCIPSATPHRNRLQHHPVQDRAGIGRHAGTRLPQRQPRQPRLPAREADRFHLRPHRRAVRPGRQPFSAVPVAADRVGRNGSSRSDAVTSSGGWSRSGSASILFLYVFVNIAMVMGAIPVGGVPSATDLLRWLGADHCDARLRYSDVGACASRCGVPGLQQLAAGLSGLSHRAGSAANQARLMALSCRLDPDRGRIAGEIARSRASRRIALRCCSGDCITAS